MSFMNIKIGRIPNRFKNIELKQDHSAKDRLSVPYSLKHFSNCTILNQYNLAAAKILEKIKLPFLHNSDEIIIISFLRNKSLQIFKERTKEFEQHEKLYINCKVADYDKKLLNDLKIKNLLELTKHAHCMLQLVKELPGFQKLPREDQEIVVSESFFSVLAVRTAKLFINGNFFYMLDEKTVLSSDLFELITTRKVRDVVFEFYARLTELKLTDQEYALLIPIFFTIFSNIF